MITSEPLRVNAILQRVVDLQPDRSITMLVAWGCIFGLRDTWQPVENLSQVNEDEVSPLLLDLRNQVKLANSAFHATNIAQKVGKNVKGLLNFASVTQLQQDFASHRKGHISDTLVQFWDLSSSLLGSDEKALVAEDLAKLEQVLIELELAANGPGIADELRYFLIEQIASIRRAILRSRIIGAEALVELVRASAFKVHEKIPPMGTSAHTPQAMDAVKRLKGALRKALEIAGAVVVVRDTGALLQSAFDYSAPIALELSNYVAHWPPALLPPP